MLEEAECFLDIAKRLIFLSYPTLDFGRSVRSGLVFLKSSNFAFAGGSCGAGEEGGDLGPGRGVLKGRAASEGLIECLVFVDAGETTETGFVRP